MFLCPSCKSSNNVKNGNIHNGKQSRLCKDCRRQFAEDPDKNSISAEKREIVDRLLLDKLSLAGICRACKSPKAGCMTTSNSNTPRFPSRWMSPPKKRRLKVQMDEMWSAGLSSVVMLVALLTTETFVGSKMQKVWLWMAQDEDTREIVGCAIGDRSAETAQELWDSLPAVYRQCAFIHTDFWKTYAKVLPSKRYKAVGKETGKTCYIERLNNTFRQQISRLVRKTLSFSKKFELHKAAIWNFIHHYNASLRHKLS